MWNWVAHCFKNYAAFRGRASRSEYWCFWLFLFFTTVLINSVKTVSPGFGLALSLTWAAFTIVPHLAVSSRRLHDSGHSFWWVVAPLLAVSPAVLVGLTRPAGLKGDPAFFLLFLAFFGLSIWLVILLANRSAPGPNRYGDPAPTTPD